MSKVSCVSGGKAPKVSLRMARAELLRYRIKNIKKVKKCFTNQTACARIINVLVMSRQRCGSAGIGRQARLRILWLYDRVGSSPIFRMVRPQRLAEVFVFIQQTGSYIFTSIKWTFELSQYFIYTLSFCPSKFNWYIRKVTKISLGCHCSSYEY